MPKSFCIRSIRSLLRQAGVGIAIFDPCEGEEITEGEWIEFMKEHTELILAHKPDEINID